MQLSTENKSLPFHILPVAATSDVSYGEGAPQGAQAIIDALNQIEPYDLFTKVRAIDSGIFMHGTISGDDPKAVADIVCSTIDAGSFTVLLGGDHSTPIGAIDAYRQKYDNLSVLQLDAHPDLFYSWNNQTHNHRTFGCHAAKCQSLVQVGLRSCDEDELELARTSDNVYQHFMHEHNDFDPEKIINQLTSKVYISIDVDAFDPMILSGTGTPEPGGFHWYGLLALLKEVFATRDVVGCDIVEYAPSSDVSIARSESYMLAKLLYALFGLKQLKL